MLLQLHGLMFAEGPPSDRCSNAEGVSAHLWDERCGPERWCLIPGRAGEIEHSVFSEGYRSHLNEAMHTKSCTDGLACVSTSACESFCAHARMCLCVCVCCILICYMDSMLSQSLGKNCR